MVAIVAAMHLLHLFRWLQDTSCVATTSQCVFDFFRENMLSVLAGGRVGLNPVPCKRLNKPILPMQDDSRQDELKQECLLPFPAANTPGQSRKASAFAFALKLLISLC